MDDDDIYDEFGNVIGDPLDSDAESSASSDSFASDMSVDKEQQEEQEQSLALQQNSGIVTLSETFGEGVETVVQTHDNQLISEPLVKPKTIKVLKVEDKKIPRTVYSKEYMAELLGISAKVRNVSFVGSLNSGKTSFLDMLLLQTHILKNNSKISKPHKRLRYTDNEKLEIERGLTLKASLITLLLPNLKGNSIVFNLIDTPGHINFADEIAVAQRLTDLSVVFIDVVEGLSITSKIAIENALVNNIQLAFVISKIDRLILELRIPPNDSFHKIRNIIDEINTFVQGNRFYEEYKFKTLYSPELNNILFASADLGFSFTLKSFAALYGERFNVDLDISAFSKRLWGDIYYNDRTRKFARTGEHRSFVHFILEPLYKIVTQSITQPTDVLFKSLRSNLGITLPKSLLKSDPQVLLKEIFKLIFGTSAAFVDMLENLTSPQNHTKSEIYTGYGKSEISNAIDLASTDGPLVAYIAKMIDNNLSLIRIVSGSLKIGDEIRILGENYNEDDEDLETIVVENLYISGGRYKVPIMEAPAGSIVLLDGVNIISKSGTIYGSKIPQDQLFTFRAIDYLIHSVFKIVIQPQVPSELPKLLDGLKKINKSYCGVEIKVEESGEHVIFGSGELYLDSLLHDLRNVTEIGIKVSDPITKFSETILDSSVTKISIKSLNMQNEITIIAEPLEEKLAIDIEKNKFKDVKKINKILRNEYSWDSLAARSVWAFGPNSNGPNILLDDTLADEVDKNLLNSLKQPIIQGFQWAVREGPLADEPIRNIKFKIIEIDLADDVLQRGNGQIIPMVRKACYSAFLASTPRLMEPIYSIEIISTSQTIKIIEQILDRRRGAVIKDSPIAATQLYRIYGIIPVIDSIGVETDIRVATQGQALVSLYFNKWSVVPGDPMDKDLFIPKLSPAPINSLARDFVMKTRKRKGLTGEPSLAKYIDRELVMKLKEVGFLDD